MFALRIRTAYLVLALFVGLLHGAGEALAQAIVGTVPAASGEVVAVNPATNRIYVLNGSANHVTVVDGASHATSTIAVGRNPQFVAVNTVTNKIFVSNSMDASLTIIDGATHTTVTLEINGAGPMVVDESANKIYVIRQGNNGEVVVVDGNNLTWYAMDTGSFTPAGLALNPALDRLYVSHNLSGDVRAIDTTSTSDHPSSMSILIPGHPTAIALNTNTRFVYVLSDDARSPVSVIDGATFAVTHIPMPGHGIGPRVVAVNPTSNKAYAGFSDELVIVDGATNALTFVPMGAVLSIAVNATSNKVYVLDNARTLRVFDGTTNTFVTIPITGAASSVAVNPSTNRAYVAGAGLTVIEGAAAPVPQPAPGINTQGLWWGANGTESGWGINVSHQGDTLFATWFTYDAQGRDMWLVMSNGTRTGTNTYEGALYRTTGPVFSSANFDPSQVVRTQVGTISLTFSDANTGSLAATVDGVQINKSLSRQLYASPVPTCTSGGAAGATPNYQDLWWRSPAGSESGWGVNITHQGDILFITWFTYASDGTGMWVVGSSINKTGNASFAGTLYRTTGPPVGAQPWDASRVTRDAVGSITFTFNDVDNGTMSYTLDGATQVKAITRQVYASPTSVCQ